MTAILSAILAPILILFPFYEWVSISIIGFLLYLFYFLCFCENDQLTLQEILSFLSSVFFSIALAYLIYEYRTFLNIDFITILSFIIAISSLPALIVYFRYERKMNEIANEKANEELRKDMERYRKSEERIRLAEIKKYGPVTKTIRECGSSKSSPDIRIFGESNMVEICGIKYNFQDILFYTVEDEIISDLHMSKPSMYGRGLVGGLLFGKLGAVAGVLTAKHYEEISIIYTIHIHLSSGSQRIIRTESIDYLEKLCAELDSIIYQA